MAKARRVMAPKKTVEGVPFDLPRVTPAEKRRAGALLAALDKEYPDAHCELDYRSQHELLIATILSAQCTDVAVNEAKAALCARYPTPAGFPGAQTEAL